MFPAVIDNTIRKDFVQCPTLAMYRHVRSIRPEDENSVDLHFGKCFARGLEVARKHFYVREIPFSGCPDDAVEAGIEAAVAEWGDFAGTTKGYKSLGRLPSAIRYYFEQWALGGDGLTPMPDGIECKFSIELPLKHPDTGEQLLYAGRYDMKATNADGRIYIVDEKTASRLGDLWWLQWDLDSQMTGYLWSVRQEYLTGDKRFEPEVPEMMALVRGISILKDGYGHAEVAVTRPQWMIDRWYVQLLRDVRRMIGAYRANEWDLALHSNSCVCYGRACDYAPLCLTPNPEQRIVDEYKTVVWNPLT